MELSWRLICENVFSSVLDTEGAEPVCFFLHRQSLLILTHTYIKHCQMSLPEMSFLFQDLCGKKNKWEPYFDYYMLAKFLFLNFKNVQIFLFCSCPSLSSVISYYSPSSRWNTLFFCYLPKHISISTLVSFLILFHSPTFPVCFNVVHFTRCSSSHYLVYSI